MTYPFRQAKGNIGLSYFNVYPWDRDLKQQSSHSYGDSAKNSKFSKGNTLFFRRKFSSVLKTINSLGMLHLWCLFYITFSRDAAVMIDIMTSARICWCKRRRTARADTGPTLCINVRMWLYGFAVPTSHYCHWRHQRGFTSCIPFRMTLSNTIPYF